MEVVVVSGCRNLGIHRGFVVVVVVAVVGGSVAVGMVSADVAGNRRGVFVALGQRRRNGMLIGLVIGVRRCSRVRPS